MTRKARGPLPTPGPWWVPNLDLSRATALAVPAGRRYRQAVFSKLVGLLERAGRPAARAAVQGYLEFQEHEILALDFPDGWAEQILSSGTMPELVAMGNPEEAEPAGQELMKEAVDGQGELSLESFLGAAPSGAYLGGTWDDDPGPVHPARTGLEGLTVEDIERIVGMIGEGGCSSKLEPIKVNGLTAVEREIGIDLSAQFEEIEKILAELKERDSK